MSRLTFIPAVAFSLPRLGLSPLPHAVLFSVTRFRLDFGRLGMIYGTRGRCTSKSQYILTIAALAFALASGLPNQVSADELKEAKVTQVIQDVRVLPSNASPRPAAVNDDVRHGTAVQTGVQSRND